MSPTAPPYRAPAPTAAGVIRPRRVTRVQVALVTAASLGALGSFVLFTPRTAPPPTPTPDAPAVAPTSTTLPLPPVVRAEPRPAIPPRPHPLPPPSSQAGAAMEQALACLRTGGATPAVNRCIVNALQDRASTEPEQRLLCITLRQMGDRAHAVACMRRYLQRYPDTRYTMQFVEYVLRD